MKPSKTIIFCIGWPTFIDLCQHNQEHRIQWNTIISEEKNVASKIFSRIKYIDFYQKFINNLISKKFYPFNLVFIDADETKFKNKVFNGKHGIINASKTAMKQYMYSFTPILHIYGSSQLWFDCGWIGYDNNEGKFPRDISANWCILCSIMMCETSCVLLVNNTVFDIRIYDLLLVIQNNKTKLKLNYRFTSKIF